MKRPQRQTIEIDVGELRAVLERARQEPISEADYRKMKVAIDVLAERLTRTRTTETTRAVVEQRPLESSQSASEGGKHRAGKGTDDTARVHLPGHRRWRSATRI